MPEYSEDLIMQHAKIDTFIKHYLRQKVTADTRAIVSGYEPQRDLMRAACRMARWIDPNRPQELTPEESLSVNQDPDIRRLVAERGKWKPLKVKAVVDWENGGYYPEVFQVYGVNINEYFDLYRDSELPAHIRLLVD
jgi:hypothetical protein